MLKSEAKDWHLIVEFYIQNYNKQKTKIRDDLKNAVKLSISLDEWADLNHQIYLMLLINKASETFNLGLFLIPAGSSFLRLSKKNMNPMMSKGLQNNLNKHIEMFESTAEKTVNLCNLQKTLLIIKPTSTDCERAFSIARLF